MTTKYNHYQDILTHTRSMGDSAIPLQKALIKQYAKLPISTIAIATLEQDRKNGIDLIVTDETGKQWAIGLRSRAYSSNINPNWLNEITIRSALVTQNGLTPLTEIDKLINGDNQLDYYIYSWVTSSNTNHQTIIIDMDKMRQDMKKHNVSTQQCSNNDGSDFVAIKIKDSWIRQRIEGVTGYKVEI